MEEPMTQIVPPLAEMLADLPDFRRAQGKRHPLLALLLLASVAMLCGARSQSAITDWGKNYGLARRKHLGFTRRDAPSQSTIQRLFAGIDVSLLEARLSVWAQRALVQLPATDCAAPPLEGIAMDGKQLRMSAQCGAADAHLLSAISQRLGLVLGQMAVADKSNEIPAAPDLLAMLVLTGKVVTADALLTQRMVSETILDAGGDYLLVVKENQPTLHAEIATLFADPTAPVVVAEEVTTHSQRHECRRVRASTELVGYTDWPGLQQVLCMQRWTTDRKTGRMRTETAYAITSLTSQRASAGELLTLWRQHWHIENKLHWVRDVTFDEDRSTVRVRRAPQVMAALRNTAIGLHRLLGATNIAAACRHYAAEPALALAAVGLMIENE